MFDSQSSPATERPATCPVHANKDHPAIKPPRVGILVANLGTPDATEPPPLKWSAPIVRKAED